MAAPALARRLAVRYAPGVMADRARRYERGLRERQGVTAAARALVQRGEAIVQAGPFAGLRYPAERLDEVDAPAAKLLGSYERELSPVFAAAVNAGVRTFVDIGCADGYYAVGMARATPGLTTHAFDLSGSARRLCRAVAELNAVSDRVRVRGRFEPRVLDDITVAGGLLLCDIEGAEHRLFDRPLVQRLRDVTVVIEVHVHENPAHTDDLGARLARTHAVQVIRQAPRPPVDGLPAVAVAEFRDRDLHWLVAEPRGRPPS
jgi:hypothetical protein